MSQQGKFSSKLAGARILVVGGSAGIGYAVAEASIESGAGTVIISSSNIDRVNAAVARLRESYHGTNSEIVGFPCDLGNEDTLESNIAALFDAATVNGALKLDHVVSTAGEPPIPRPLQEVDLAFARRAGLVRFFAPMMIAKHAADHMSPGPASSITLTTGASGQRPIPHWVVLGSYTAGLQGMARSLALELRPLRVNVISHGAVRTELVEGLVKDLSPEERQMRLDAFAKNSATGVIGKPEDAAESYLYAMRDHNLTGTTISTNGGLLIM